MRLLTSDKWLAEITFVHLIKQVIVKDCCLNVNPTHFDLLWLYNQIYIPLPCQRHLAAHVNSKDMPLCSCFVLSILCSANWVWMGWLILPSRLKMNASEHWLKFAWEWAMVYSKLHCHFHLHLINSLKKNNKMRSYQGGGKKAELWWINNHLYIWS